MSTYLCFRVELLDVEPQPWRAFAIRNAASFWDLHVAIQDACGWENSHLFAFLKSAPLDQRSVIAGIPDDGGFGEPDPDAQRIKLVSFFKPNGPKRCLYQYDFGDDWRHTVELVETIEVESRFVRELLAGEGTFPPEDCGGIYGYERCIAAVTGKGWTVEFGDEDERKELLEWLGDWRPDSFDFEKAKKKFARRSLR